jgi:hypothetical protein
MPNSSLWPKMAKTVQALVAHLKVPLLSPDSEELTLPAYYEEFEWLSGGVSAIVSCNEDNVDERLYEQALSLARKAQEMDPLVVPSPLYDSNGNLTTKPGLVIYWYHYDEVRVLHVVSAQ